VRPALGPQSASALVPSKTLREFEGRFNARQLFGVRQPSAAFFWAQSEGYFESLKR
jgi:hypothetical protein